MACGASKNLLPSNCFLENDTGDAFLACTMNLVMFSNIDG